MMYAHHIWGMVALAVLVVGAAADPAREPLEAQLVTHHGRETIFLNGEPVAPVMYHLTGGAATRTWDPIPRENLTNFAKAGYRLLGSEVWLGQIWHEDDSLDMPRVQRQLATILEIRPDAALLVRVHVDPPAWWLDRHPEECAGFALAPSTIIPEAVRQNPAELKRVSFASQAWQHAMGATLARFLRELAALPEGDAVFAIHVAGGEWGEWFYYSFELEPDTGPAMTRHFQRWLRERYRSEAALQAAWNDEDVTFAAATVPDVASRFRTSQRMFRDPATEQRTIDYYRCHQELVADTPLFFCQVVRETWPRGVLVGVFHGYFFHLNNQASGGHLEMHRVLESPYVDYLASPLSYEFDARFVGGTGHFRCLSETIRVHKKLWLCEVDHPTLLGDHFERPKPFSPSTIEDSIATMRRNVAHMFTSGQGIWWYDFGPPGRDGQGGWWNHPELMREAESLRTLAGELLQRPFVPAADVLFVYDTECFYYLAPMYLSVYEQSAHWDRTETLSFEAANRTIADAYKSGAAVATVHLDDLARIELDRYRAVVFAFTPVLDDADLTVIRERVLTPGRTVVWVYAPGYIDGHRLNTARISEIVGITIEESEIQLPPQLLLRDGSLCPEFPETRIDTTIRDAWTAPTFHAVDRDAKVYGFYGGSREIALARKRVGETDVWYSALPLRGPAVMREIFRQAGAHIYNEHNDVLHASESELWIHTETGGDRTIRLRTGTERAVNLEPWSTIIVDAKTGAPLRGAYHSPVPELDAPAP